MGFALARKLAELLRAGLLSAVHHGETGLRTLKELCRSYLAIGKDLARNMNRIKALYRSWSIGNSKSTVEHGRSVIAGRSETVQSFFRSHIDSAFRECGSRVGAFAQIIHRQYVPITAGLHNGNFSILADEKNLAVGGHRRRGVSPKAALTRPALNT